MTSPAGRPAHGAVLGMVVCIAMTACAAFGAAACAALVAGPPLLMALDIVFGSAANEPPFRWLEPMSWMIPVAGVLGAATAAGVAWRRLRVRV